MSDNASFTSSFASSQFDLNDDYDYLINCRQIIKTCQEALLEVPSHESTKVTSDESTPNESSSHELIFECNSSGPSSLSSTASSVCTSIQTSDLTTSCSLFDFNQWLTYTEKRINSVCSCHERSQVYQRQKCIQSEIERVGHKFISGIKKLLEENTKLAANSKSSKSKALIKLEKKWHNLWIRSLEYLICIETGRCPGHFGNNSRTILKDNSTSLNSPDQPRDSTDQLIQSQVEHLSGQPDHTPPNSSSNLTSTATCSSLQTKEEQSQAQTPPGRSTIKFRPLTSTPRKATKAYTVASLIDHFDLPQITIANLMKNQRVQTMNASSSVTTQGMSDLKGSKFEIIHKDIGYSSDADTSDATADATSSGFIGSSASSSASSILSDLNNCGKGNNNATVVTSDTQQSASSSQGPKRRLVKRRNRMSPKLIGSTSCGTLYTCKQRPWSFHAASEWTDWDYYQPPSFIPSNECISNENVNTSPFDDESTLRSLTEFGENYEHWFKTDDGAIALRMSIEKTSSFGVQVNLSESKIGDESTVEIKDFDEESERDDQVTPLKFNLSESKQNFTIDEDECSPLTQIQCNNNSSTASVSTNTTNSTTTVTRSIGTSTNCSSSTTSSNNDSNSSNKKRKSKSWILFVAVSLVSLLVSVFLACTRATHIELLYPTNLPPI